MADFSKNFHLSWSSFLDYLPALLGGIICLIVTFLLANFLSRMVSKYTMRRTKDSLIANFIGKIIWAIVFIVGAVLTLGILGLGTISNKILAGAGITTFVVGFALKDIGENFLAGIILAFSRPYRVGNYIECLNVKGVVKDMTMRQTTVEAENGRTILVPNSMIINNPLTRYSGNDNNMRQEFFVSVEAGKVKEAIEVIRNVLKDMETIAQKDQRAARIVTDSLAGDKVKLVIVFWFDATNFKGSRSGTRSQIITTVIEKLNEAGIKFSG